MERTKETSGETMSDYITPLHGRHPSKQGVFRNECGGCGKPLYRNAKNKIGYLCRKCYPIFELDSEKQKFACNYCPFELDCTARVQLGLWIRCETPDIADLERLRFMGGLYDEDVRRELEKALEKSGNRKILEEAVSNGASKIYQSCIEG